MAKVKDVPSDEAPAEKDVNHQLYDVCERGDEEAVTSLLPKTTDINWKNNDDEQKTFLHAAAAGGHLPVVKLLLNNHADLHVKDENHITVLHCAGYSGNIDLMKYLIDKGSLVTAKAKDDATVLHLAARGGCSVEVLEYLVDKGASVAAKDKDDSTVLHAAAAGNCSVEVLKYLLDNGVSVAAKNKNDATILHYASYGGCSNEVLNYLIDKGVSLAAKDKDGWTTLHFACEGGHWGTIQYLLEKKLSLDDKDKDGDTPIKILKNKSTRSEEETERRRKCLQLLQANDDHNHKVDSTPSDSSNVKSDPEEDVKSKTQTQVQDQPAQKIDYKPFLEKAAAEGTVKTRSTNLGLSGASGTGKTSTLRLLTDQEPEYTHNSTSVIQPMMLFKDNSPYPEDEEEGSSSDLDTDSDDSDKEQPEHEPAPTVRTTKRYLLIANKHKWTSATRNALFHRLANSVVELAHTPEKSNSKEKSKGSMMKKGMFYPFRPLEQSASHSAAATAMDGPPLKRRKMLTMSFEDLQAAKEILDFIESHKDLKDLGITHFVNVNDTGGQAAFIDIAPALMRYNSINLVLIKLDEPLNGKAQFFYSVRGKRVGTEKRQITTKSLVIAMFSSKMKIQKPQVEGLEYSENCGKPQFIVLGTHYDKYKQKGQHEKLEMKDEELLKCLRDFKDVLIANGDKVIFPLNTLARDKRSLKLAAKIRKLVTKCYIEAEVPTRWYIFRVAIYEIKGSKGNKDIIQFSKLLEIGSLIKIFEEELKAALQYFHDLMLCLYYPNILPDVVFATPQCLFDKLSEIIAVSLGKCECGIDFGTKERLQNEGLFEKELLKQLPKGFVDGLFTPEDFLKLMEHLFIASHMPGTDTYFMPCVLETAENPLDNLPPSEVEPLLFTWNGSVPNGLFPSLIMSLKSLKPISFHMAPQKQYRNRITMNCQALACTVTLFEYPSFIGVTNTSEIPERSMKIHKAVLDGIGSVVGRFNWMTSVAFPQEAYLCRLVGCNVHFPHLCFSDMDQKLVACSIDCSLTAGQTPAHLVWYNRAASATPSSDILQKRPLLKDAYSLLQEKSSEWDNIGRGFGVPLNSRKGLNNDRSLSNEARLERVIDIWLVTSCHTQVTWGEFIKVLSHSLGFKDIAQQVQTFLEKEQLSID